MLAITDNFYNSWFSAISRNYSYYEINDMEGLKQKLDEIMPVFAGRAFEKFTHKFVEILGKKNRIFHIDAIGRWWGRDQNKPKGMNDEEIDVVAIGKRSDDILFAECKWSNAKVGIEIFNDLKRKARLVQWRNANRKECFALFSKSGFTDAMKRAAKEEDVMLFDLEAIEKALR